MNKNPLDRFFGAAERLFRRLQTRQRPEPRQENPSGLLRDKQKAERSYYAASTSGPSGRWNPSSRSDGDTDILKDGTKVRARIRDLERNNSLIQGALNRYVLNTVGEGMYFQSKVIENNAINREISKQIEDFYGNWAENAIVNGDSLYQAQQLAFRTFLRDGEAIAIRRFINRELKYQLIEIDQLDECFHGSYSKDVSAPGNYAIKGIEFNSFGKPVKYRVLDIHPGDCAQSQTGNRYQDIPAEDVFHIFYRKRPSQRRGISEFASIILDVFDSTEYTDATMTLARLAAAYGIFVVTPYPADYVELSDQEEIEYSTKVSTKNIGYVSPAAMHYLRPGEDIKSVNPNQPNGNYEGFIATRDRRAAVGIGQSYESFANDYSKSSYSSARQGMLLERQLYRFFSSFMDKHFNYRSLEQALDWGNLTNKILLPNYWNEKSKYLRGRFTRPRHEWIDLANEAKAASEEIKLGIRNRRQIAEDRGDDWEETVMELAREEQLMKDLGLGLPAALTLGNSVYSPRPIIWTAEDIAKTGKQDAASGDEKSQEENKDNAE